MKKIVSLILSLLLLSSMTFAAEFKDMPNDWSTEALVKAVENGLLTGSDGYIKAGDNMTRAEMAAIMTRATGAVEEADISEFKDVKKDDWFYQAMAKAVKMGAFKGSDGKLNPESPITRQEAFLVLSRVFGLDKNLKDESSSLGQFKDAGKIDTWAKDGVNAIVKSGYVKGNDGYINPLNNISRAEFAVVMDRLVKYYIDSPEEEIPADGNVMIRCEIPEIKGLKTQHMVVLGDALNKSEVKFTECEISGKVVVRGGSLVAFGEVKNYKDISVIKEGIVASGQIPVPVPEELKGIIYVCSGSTFKASFGL